jgi:uncharacterized membrane protein YphA (DoxX/SURF4 family)
MKPYWHTALRCFLGLLLLWAGLSKAANPKVFLGDLNAYQLPLPRGVLAVAAVALPWLELLCGLMLITRTRLPAALLCTLGLFVVFSLSTGQAVARGLDIACGCFDLSFLAAWHLSGLAHVLESVGFAFVRNLMLTAAVLALLASPASAEARETGLNSIPPDRRRTRR